MRERHLLAIDPAALLTWGSILRPTPFGAFVKLFLFRARTGCLPKGAPQRARIAGVAPPTWPKLEREIMEVNTSATDIDELLTWMVERCIVPIRSPVSAALRRQIFRRDKGKCVYCCSAEGPFHLDHVIPVSRGGKTTYDNLALACRRCNNSKGTLTIEEWRAEELAS